MTYNNIPLYKFEFIQDIYKGGVVYIGTYKNIATIVGPSSYKCAPIITLLINNKLVDIYRNQYYYVKEDCVYRYFFDNIIFRVSDNIIGNNYVELLYDAKTILNEYRRARQISK